MSIFLAASGLGLFGIMTGLIGCNKSVTPMNASQTSSGVVHVQDAGDDNTPCPQSPCGCQNETPVGDCTIPTAVPTATPTPCSNCKSPAVNYERQCNSQWATLGLGGDPATSTETICQGGCLLTCYAMIAGETPPTMNGILSVAYNSNYQLYNSDVGTIEHWSVVNEAYFDSSILDAFCKTSHPQTQYVIANVLTELSNGNLAIHYILVTGQQYDPNTQRCRFTVLDPQDQSAQYLDDTTRYPTIYGLKIIFINNS
jgi:hypothetical protein